MARVLVVDDQREMRGALRILLNRMEVEPVAAPSGEEALERFSAEQFDLVLMDLKTPGMNGVELIRRIHEMDATVPVIVMTAYDTVQTAADAMKEGAFDFVLEPFDLAAIEVVIRNALEMRRYRTQRRFLQEQAASWPSFENLIGVSAAMQSICDLVRQIGPTKSAVLITGEAGTGKDLVAHALHRVSPRREHLFVPVNCAAMPAELLETELFDHRRRGASGAPGAGIGKIELADGGTLFLDEIGDLPPPLQARLVGVLREGVLEGLGGNRSVAVNVRVVSSTKCDLVVAMQEGRFREDLYHHLDAFHIHVPALRERVADVGPLAGFFLRQFGAELGKHGLSLDDESVALLERYPWPGNVRELRNLMERAAVLCTAPEVGADLVRTLVPSELAAGEGHAGAARQNYRLEPAIDEVERTLIQRALAASSNKKAEAARLLGISERTLWYKLKRHGL